MLHQLIYGNRGTILKWSGAPTASTAGYAPGCIWVDDVNGVVYYNSGTAASATWTSLAASAVDIDAAYDNGAEIDGADSSANAVKVGDGSDYVAIYRNAAGDVRIGTGGTSDLTIVPDGGDTTITGTLTVSSTLDATGDFAINTNKFQVTASSGNTAVAGTLDVTGNATLSGDLAVTGNITGTFTGTWGATSWSSTALTITGTTDTGQAVKIVGDSVTTGDVLRLHADASLTTGYFLRCVDGSTDKLKVAEDGAVTITGTASGSDAIAITAGDITLTSGDLTLSEGNADLTGAADSEDLVDITRNNSATGGTAIDIDMGTATVAGNAVDISFGGAATGDGLVVDMTNAVAGSAINLTGAGTRTDRLITVADASGGAGAETVFIAKSAGAASMVLLDANGAAGADTLEIDHDGQLSGRGVHVHSAEWTGASDEGLLELATSGTSIPAGQMLRINQAATGQHASAISGSALYVADAATAPGSGTSYAVTVDATNIEALRVATGQVSLAEALTVDSGGITVTAGDVALSDGRLTVADTLTSTNDLVEATLSLNHATNAASAIKGALVQDTTGRSSGDVGALEGVATSLAGDSGGNYASFLVGAHTDGGGSAVHYGLYIPASTNVDYGFGSNEDCYLVAGKKLVFDGTDGNTHLYENSGVLTLTCDGNVQITPAAGANGSVIIGDLTTAGESELHIKGDDDSDHDPGFIVLYDHAGADYYLWVDATGDLRINGTKPADQGSDGTVVGAQS